MPEFKCRVHTIPLTVNFGDEEYIDGVTIDHKTFYEKLIESDVLPTTSQATQMLLLRNLKKQKRPEKRQLLLLLLQSFPVHTKVLPLQQPNMRMFML